MTEESSQNEADAAAQQASTKAEKTQAGSSVATAIEESTKKLEELSAVSSEKPKPEIGAATLARMAGLATGGELKVLEGKLDLLAGRMANLTIRVERALTMLGNLPSGNDFERLDVNVASVKTMLKEFVERSGGSSAGAPDEKVTKAKLDAFLKRKTGTKDGDGGAGSETPPAAG